VRSEGYGMEKMNIYEALKDAPMDDYAGIKIVKLTGDASLSVYVADIAPHTKLTPHYHKEGIDTYQILKGTGTMKTAPFVEGEIHWSETFTANEGDCFHIAPGIVHQILNETDETLILVFTCPESHVSTDRHFVEIRSEE
jgi:quercetin dioxygenase-like cupin family protein